MKTYKILLILFTAMVFSSSIFSQKWIVQHSGLPDSENPTLVFSAVNPNVCWGVQQLINPKCVVTTNGGMDWKMIDLGGIPGLSELAGESISAINADTAWITLNAESGTAGGIFKTTNGGNDWVKQESAFPGADSHPRTIHFFDAQNGLCTGNPRDGYWEVYTTTDGGTNWTRVPNTNIPISNTDDFIFGGTAFGNTYWFTTIFNGVYKSTDKGLTWSTAPSTSTEVAFKDEMNGLGISYFVIKINKLYTTTTGGESWTQLSSAPVYPSAYFLNYVPGTNGTYLVTSHSNIDFPESTMPGSAYTTDDGQHWTVIDSLAHGHATFTTGNVGWSAGSGDTIYKWVQETPTDIIPDGSVVTKLSSDQFTYTEGPVWYKDSVLLFIEDAIGAPNIFQYNPVRKQVGSWPTISPHCLGLTMDKGENLIGTSSDIIMIKNAGQDIETVASEYNGKPFNNPNDLIADKKGGIYFSDPDFFLTSPPQDKTAVYYIDPTGVVKRVIDDLAKPNGLVLSPDGTRLYVVDTQDKYVYSWDVAEDGSISGKSSLAELDTVAGITNYADGMAIDSLGNIYVATGAGIQVFTPQGVAITTIAVPEQPSNCDFGGKDFKTLFITAQKNIYSIDLNYPGYAVYREGDPSGLNPVSNQQLVTIYPNPVQNVMHLHFAGNKGKLEVFDATGKLVLQKEIQEENPSFDVSALKQGIYLVKVLSDTQLMTGKFVKQ